MISKILFQFKLLFYCVLCSCAGGESISEDSETQSEVFCVTLTEYSDLENVCQGYNSTENHTLAYYLTHSSVYFKSYQTYVFEYGYHTPLDNVTLQIRSVTNLTLTGLELDRANSSRMSVIDCNGRAVSFKFMHTSNVIIKNITFTSCFSQYSSHNDVGLATLVFFYGSNLSLLGITVLTSVDEAFLIFDVAGNVVINDVEVGNSNTAGKARYQSGNGITYRKCFKNETSNIYIMNSRFINNSLTVNKRIQAINAGGLSINIKCPDVKVKIVNVTMLNNTGNAGGNLAITLQSYSNVTVEIVDSHLEGGKSFKGGGMFVAFIETPLKNVTCQEKAHQNRILHVYNTNFTSNVATKLGGGGVFVKQMQSLPKCNIECITFEKVTFNSNSVTETYYGGGIAIHSITFVVTGYVHHGNPQFQVFLNHCSINNSHVKSLERGDSGTGVIFVNSNLFFQLNNTAIFNNKATGIVGMSSNIILSNNITIVNNTGTSGGGMLLCQNSVIYLEAYASIIITNNSASNTGGGICVETSDYIESQEICFFQLGYHTFMNISLIKTISVVLHDNSASLAGSNLFGGSIDQCYLVHHSNPKHSKVYQSIHVYKTVFKTAHNTKHSPSSVTSPARRLCLCQSSRPNCSLKPLTLQKFPGETFFIEAVLVGQFYGTVPGTVQASLNSSKSSLKQGEYVQNLSSIICNELRYTISTSHGFEILKIRVQHVGGISGFTRRFQEFTIHAKMKECPLGFTHMNAMCNCNLLLGDHASCDITTQTVKRQPPVWIGIIKTGESSKTVAYHDNCPFDYCASMAVELFATNDSLSQDRQCAFNRTGVLCGRCAEGLSTVLGSSECKPCSNYWILLLLPFALIGVAFLVVLILFNITIANGTLSGVIFYCNIIMSSNSIFFHRNLPFLTLLLKWFISFVNLDVGVSTCLYNGMDSYSKAWLDFAFPLYLWFLTGVFIFLGCKFSWVVRHNAVKVLATLILVSYTRLLSAIAGALQVAHIHLENGGTEDRWLTDGNIKYFKGKHIPLAIFAVMFGLLLLPFALSLFFIQWLQRVSDYKAFSWVNHLKPLFDVYTGPFTSRGRFWTGLLLLARGVLLIVTAVNVSGDPKANLGAIILTVLLLFLVIALLPTGLYRHKYLNALESLSLINLGVLASLLFMFPNSNIISHVCVSTELLIFIGIVISHFKLIHKSCCYIRLRKLMLRYGGFLGINEAADKPQDDEVAIPYRKYYYNEDREPLLADEKRNITVTY